MKLLGARAALAAAAESAALPTPLRAVVLPQIRAMALERLHGVGFDCNRGFGARLWQWAGQ